MRIIYKRDTDLKPALFLDRDGVINRDKKGRYITKLKDIKIYPSAIEGLKGIVGYHLIILTNQSAIGRRMMDLEDFKVIDRYIIKTLTTHKIYINATYFCPHIPEENCQCRKPKTGLVREAMDDFRIDLKRSVVIGDKITDIELGKRLGIKTIMVLTGQGREEVKKNKGLPDVIVNNLRSLKKLLCLFLLLFFQSYLLSQEDPFLGRIFTKRSTLTYTRELFDYDIYWGFIEVGKASIEFGEVYESEQGERAYRIVSRASSNQFIDNIFKVRDVNVSYLDLDYSKSYGYYKDIKEGKYQFTEYTIYDYKTKRFYGMTIMKDTIKEHSGEIIDKAVDVLSSLFIVMRSTDIEAPRREINIITKTPKKIDVINHGVESIKTPFGKITAYKFEPKVGEEGIFVAKKGRSMYVYISCDKRIPLLLEAEVFIGSVKAVLKRYTLHRAK